MCTWDIYLPKQLIEEKGLAYQSVDVLMAEFGRYTPGPMCPNDSKPAGECMAVPSECSDALIQQRVFASEHVEPMRRAPLMDTDVNARPANSPLFNRLENKSSTTDPWLRVDSVTGHARAPRLHEFILQLLANDQYSYLAEYVDRKAGIFRFRDPIGVANLWSSVRRRNSDSSKSTKVV